MNAIATLANTAWWASNLPAWWRFQRALHRPEATQTRVLQNILRSATDTAFGREHAFAAIHTYEDFRSRVPPRSYDELSPWIDRIRAGEQRVLTAERVIRLATTGGSSGGRKLIPYTSRFQAELSRAIAPWIVDLFHRQPSVMTGSAYWSISPAAREPDESSAIPIGFQDDSEYLGGIQRRLIDAVMAVPSNIAHARDMETWRRETIKHLAATCDLKLISIWHPSFLALLLESMPISPQESWPKLRHVSCWADAHAALAADALAEQFPGVTVCPKGLIATEGIVSIPFRGHWPLAIRSHFFEFIDAAGNIRRAHELAIDQTYEVLLTTGGGLYRYRLGDAVRVSGFVGATPSIRFIGKLGNVSDRFGEKLDEVFVTAALATLRAELKGTWTFALLAPDGPRYTLYLDDDAPADLAARLDTALRANPHYAYCRDLGQLNAPTLFRIVGVAEAQYRKRLTDAGQRMGNIKATSLSRLDRWCDRFAGDYVPPL